MMLGVKGGEKDLRRLRGRIERPQPSLEVSGLDPPLPRGVKVAEREGERHRVLLQRYQNRPAWVFRVQEQRYQHRPAMGRNKEGPKGAAKGAERGTSKGAARGGERGI